MKTNKLVFDYLKEKKKTLILYLVCCILYYPLHIVTFTIIFGQIFEKLGNIKMNKNIIKYLSFLAIILFVIENVSVLAKEKIESFLIPDFNYKLRNLIFENIIHKLRINYKDLDIGEVISRITIITVKWDEITGYLAGSLIPRSLTLIMIVFFLLYLNKFFAGITVLYLALVTILMKPRYSKCFDKFLKVRYTMNDRSNYIQDKISNLFEIYISNKETQEIKKNRIKEKEYNDQYETALKCNLYNSSLISIGSILYLGTMVYFIINGLINGNIKVSTGITILLIVTYVTTITDLLFNHFTLASQAYTVLKESESFLEYISNFKEDNRKLKPILNGNIHIKNVFFQYKKDPILRDINLKINNNDKIIIKGKSGSGKSTLVKLICGFYKTNSGKITLNNYNINDLNLEHLRSQISMLNQNVKLFNISIYKNIQYNNNISKKNIDKFINDYKINLYNSIDLNNLAGQNGNNLSGGQKQMTLILRILLNPKKKIIIFDEPTSALDNYHFSVFMNLVKKMDKTIIIITHDSRFDKSKFSGKYHLENTYLKKIY